MTVVSHCFFKDSRVLNFMFWMSFFTSLFTFDLFNYSATFAAILNVELIFGWLLSWLLAIFTNCFFLYYVFICYAELILLYMPLQFVTGLFRLLSFFTYNLSI
jgi:hypothetical protein